MHLFSDAIETYNLPQATLIYMSNAFNIEASNQYFSTLKTKTKWQQYSLTVFGKTYQQPRLTALFGNTNKTYTYSNITMQPQPFTATLKTIKHKVEVLSKHQYNSVLLNFYRDGNDSNGWHADNEKELGKNPVIASVSFGAERFLYFKHKILKNQKHKLLLQHGSLLIMKGEMQHFWLHQIAKTKKPVGNRINLTFRQLK